MSRKLTPITLLIKIFEADGFSVVRRTGGSYHHDETWSEILLVIKSSPKRVPVTHIRTNMRTAGMYEQRAIFSPFGYRRDLKSFRCSS